jgi:hypothetical protein
VKLLAAVLATAVVAGVARADADLAEARRLQAALDYEGALAVVDKALAHGGADPDRLAELHLLAGTLAAGLDRNDVAEDHFARLLALRPGQRLPDGTSPKIAGPFEAALARKIPALHVTPTYVHGVVTIVPDADPLHLVVALEVRVVDSLGRLDDLASHDGLRVVLPPGTKATEATALDASGNRVWVGAIAEPPPPVVHIPLYASWKLYAAGAGVATAFGLFAWQRMVGIQDEWDTLRADNFHHDYTQLTRTEARGREWATIANVSFAIGGAFAIAAGIQAVRNAKAKASEERVGLRVIPGPGDIGIGLAWGTVSTCATCDR